MPSIQRINENQTFRADDLHLAAYLMTCGLRLWGIEYHDPTAPIFVLTPQPLPSLLAAYAEGLTVVNVTALGRALRTLKRIVQRYSLPKEAATEATDGM